VSTPPALDFIFKIETQLKLMKKTEKSSSKQTIGKDKYIIMLVCVIAVIGAGYYFTQQKVAPEIPTTTTTTRTTEATTQTTTEGLIEIVSRCPGADFSLTDENDCTVAEDNTNTIHIQVRNVGNVELTEKHFKMFVKGVQVDFYQSSKGLIIPAGGSVGYTGILTIVAKPPQGCTNYGAADTCSYIVSLPCANIAKPTLVTCS
jgi:hypothetical protein